MQKSSRVIWLPIVGTIDQLREASEMLRAPLGIRGPLVGDRRGDTERDKDRRIAELAIGGDSTLVGKSVREARIADRFGVLVLGTYRAADTQLFPSRVPAAERLDVGDVLLVQGTAEGLVELERTEGTMVLRDVLELPRTAKAPIALAITAAVIVLATLKLVPIAIAALGRHHRDARDRVRALREHRSGTERRGGRARRRQHRAGPRARRDRRCCMDGVDLRAWDWAAFRRRWSSPA